MPGRVRFVKSVRVGRVDCVINEVVGLVERSGSLGARLSCEYLGAVFY
jgi:hypothetical protein